MTKKCVIYARYSSHNQTEQSIEGQLRECKDFAKRQGITVVGEYIDRALTGTTDRRPDFLRMIEDSKKRTFDYVLVYQLDRFARNRYDSATYKNKLKKNGVRVLSARENISDDASGILVEGLLESMAEYYSVELSQKVKRGQKESLSKGLALGGNITYGYKVVDKKYQTNEQQADVVKKVFADYSNDITITNIIESLNNAGIKNGKGKSFVKNSLLNMLNNRKYIGEFKHGDEIYYNIVPAIIDKYTWQKVEARLMKNKKAPARARAKEAYILSGKLYCGHCNTLMWGESGTSHTGTIYNYYKCNNAKNHRGCLKKPVAKQTIEDDVISAIMALLNDEKQVNLIAKTLVRLNKTEQDNNVYLNYVKKQIADANKSIENIIKGIEMGVVNNSVKTRLDELEKTKLDLETALDKEIAYKHLIFDEEQVIFWLESFKKGDVSSLEFRQNLIDNFVKSIYVYDDKNTKITFNTGQNNTQTVTLKEIEAAAKGLKGSYIAPFGPPSKTDKNKNVLISFFIFVLILLFYFEFSLKFIILVLYHCLFLDLFHCH